MVDENKGEVGEPEDTGKGDKSEMVKQTEKLDAAREKLEKARDELRAEKALMKLTGSTEAGQPAEALKKKPRTEYGPAVLRGENPDPKDYA